MHILVTGGLGLIGHNVVVKLLEQQHNVVVVDNKTCYGVIPKDEIVYLMGERTKKINNKITCSDKLFCCPHDICDFISMKELFNEFNFDVVIHLAAMPRQKVVSANPVTSSRVMSTALVNLLELSKLSAVNKFIYISSSMVYGDFTDEVKENAECNPIGQYGILKLAGEWLVKDYSRHGYFTHTIIRPSAVYGPLDVSDRVISKFMLSAMYGRTLKVNGAGETLDFTYVDDAANGIVQAATSDNTHNKTYNITKSHSRSLLEAAQLAIDIVGKGNIHVQDKDLNFPSRGSLNIDAARKDFNFNPKVDVEDGFINYYQWLSSSDFYGTA